MDVLPQASLFLGIIPALILLYIGLKGYEEYYKDKTIFLTFIIGIFLGFISVVVRSFFLPLLIVVIILLAFFEQLFKTIVLNIGRLQLKKETTIYGLSLGLGFGSVFTPFLIIALSTTIQNDVYVASFVAIGSLGIILFHGATGAFIGYGIFTGKMLKYLLIAIIIQLPFNALIDATRFFSDTYFLYLQLGLIIYGALIFWYVVKQIMPKILSQNQRRKRSKL
jgi:hypothetical protein